MKKAIVIISLSIICAVFFAKHQLGHVYWWAQVSVPVNRENEVIVFWDYLRDYGGHVNGFDNHPMLTDVLGHDASIQFSTTQKKRDVIPTAVTMPFAQTQNFTSRLDLWISKDTIHPVGCNSVDVGSKAPDDCVAAHPGMRPLRQVGYRSEEVWLKGRQIITPVENQADCAVSLPDKVVLDNSNYRSVAYFLKSQTLYLVGISQEPGVLYVSRGCQNFERVDYTAYIQAANESCQDKRHVYDVVPGKNTIRPTLLVESCRDTRGVLDLDTGQFKRITHPDSLFFLGTSGDRVVLDVKRVTEGHEKDKTKLYVVANVLDVDTGKEELLKSSYQPKMQMSFGFLGWLFN
ncbi:hypothetical protein ACO0LL_25640 [Undibacterium sp. TC4M20W]|uniref:hypothetical protein n=1 Tax=Undibacterium sp. TC4M20W TaxID=3413052 RepID=UPI003BF1FE6B